MKARITNVQRYSLHDGPGIRTAVFFKGCSLQCEWCCNPEAQNKYFDLAWQKNRCIGCKSCERVCPNKAIKIEETSLSINREYCKNCREKSCAAVCPSGAIKGYGEDVTVEEIMKTVERDSVFYKCSGGGITATGGEALLYPEFVGELFKCCKTRGFHTAIETSSFIPWNHFADVIPHTDLFLCDIKHVDEAIFRKHTGGDLSLITSNIKRLAKTKSEIILRVPLIPGFNADVDTLRGICLFAKSIDVAKVELLPYHRLGMAKYETLLLHYSMKGIDLLTKEELEELFSVPGEYGLL